MKKTAEEQDAFDTFITEMIERGHAERTPGTKGYRMTAAGRAYAREVIKQLISARST